MDNLTSLKNQAFPFSIIVGKTVARVLFSNLQACIETVRDAYLAHSNGRSVSPPSSFLQFADQPNARIIALPSHLDEPWRISGIKWISSFPENVRDGIPRAAAVLILNNHENGYPFACLEASIISAARTAALAVLAAANLGNNALRVHTLGIVGCGFIARYVYRFLIETGWRIEHLRLFDVVHTQTARFTTEVCSLQQHLSVASVSNIESAITDADLVLFATVANKPHVHDPALFRHSPVVLHVSLRDLAPEILLNSCNVVDDIDHVMHANTSLHLAEKLTGGRAFVAGTLADILERRLKPDHARPMIFSPFGLGILDLAVAKWVYDQAIASGEYIPIGDFFGLEH